MLSNTKFSISFYLKFMLIEWDGFILKFINFQILIMSPVWDYYIFQF